MTALVEGWPFLAAIALVGIITWGALQPYIRADKRRRAKLEKMDD